MPRHITEYVLYQWRYSIGYVLVGLLVATLLVAAVLFVPGGISSEEMASTVRSNGLSFTEFDPQAVIDLPYALLQYGSFALLGITTLSIKLPSLILGLLSLVGIILLLRHWFHTNVAVISALIVITTSQFIFTSQDGTPTIMYIFLPTWLLLLALSVSRHGEKRRGIWEILLVAVLALSLYTPLSVYIIVALVSATILHPHLRYIVGRLPRRRLLVAGVVGLVLLAPLAAAIGLEPKVGRTLLGIPEAWPDLGENIIVLFEAHLGFLMPNAEDAAQPVYTLPALLLMLLGGLHLFTTRHTARSYTITSWLLLLTPIVILNPSKTAITFVPVMLLIAAGLDELLYRWYSLFPRNPYARIAGLLPVTLLVAGMALSGAERYFYTYRYSPPVASEYTNDLKLLSNELRSEEGTPPDTLLVAAPELAFYRAVADRNDSVAVIASDQPVPDDGTFIVTRAAFYERDIDQKVPSKIITNGKSSESDRLYLYNSNQE